MNIFQHIIEIIIEKPVVDFIFVIIKLFRYLLRLRRYKRKSIEVGVFRKGWVTLSADFGGKGASPTMSVDVRVAEWLPFRVVSKYLQCIIDICHNPRVWQTDGRTDGRTDRITTPKTALAYAREVKIVYMVVLLLYEFINICYNDILSFNQRRTARVCV